MYPSQGRVWLATAGICLAFCTSCNQPPQKTTLGNLPGPTVNDLEPKVNATTYFAHGHLLERQGQLERAVVQYRKAVTLQPDFLSARNRLGITLNKLGRHAEATTEFQQAITNHAELAYLHNNLGFSLYLQGKYAEAQAALERALTLKPDFPRAHLNRALVLARLERFDDAFSELMQVGSEADACFNMGILLTEAGQFAHAARYLESALALRPNFDAAQQQLREVSRLAAEAEVRQTAPVALAPETTTDNVRPTPTEKLVADLVADVATEGAMPEPAGATTPAVAIEETTLEPTDTLVADAEIETASPEPAEPAADAGTETVSAEEAETALEQATTESVVSPAADAVVGSAMPETALTLVADLTAAVEAAGADTSPLLTAANKTEPAPWTMEPGIDPEYLFSLIDEALTALVNQSDDLETLWCLVGYYLYPETAPDEPVSAPDAASEGPGASPENVPPQESILDRPH